MAFPLTSKIPIQSKMSGSRCCLFPQGLTSSCLSFMLPLLVKVCQSVVNALDWFAQT